MIEQLAGLVDRTEMILPSRRIVLRLGIIGAQLLLMSLIVYYVPGDVMILVPAAIMGVGAIFVLLRWPAVGLVLLTFVGMFVPGLEGNDINITILLMAGIVVLWLVDMVVIRKRINLPASSAIWPLLGFAAICLISLLAGRLPWFGNIDGAPLDAQIGAFGIFFLSISVTIIAGAQIPDLRWLKVITWVFVGFGSLFIMARMTPPQWGVPNLIFQGKTFGGIFYAWFPAIVGGQLLFNKHLKLGSRLFLVFVILGMLNIVLIQSFDWKSGWITVSITLGVLLILRDWRFVFLVGVLGLISFFTFFPDVVASEDYSISTRFEAWILMADMLKNSPFLGLGFANYYWYTPLFAIRGWNVQFNSHNNYVDIVAQVGLLGLFFLIWFFVAIARVGWQLRHRVPEGFARAYVYSCLAGLVGTIVVSALGDWLLPFVYNIGMSGVRTAVLAWLFLGGLIALESMYSNKGQVSG